jgi:hypothetical protein
MCQFQNSISLFEGISTGLQSNWDGQRQAWERRRHPWEHLNAPLINLGVPVSCLEAPPITVEQSEKNIIFVRNITGVPGNHSYYLLFNDF